MNLMLQVESGVGRVKWGDSFVGYAAGIIAGVSYGLNPLFGKHLLERGVPVYSLLFFRYVFAALMMAAYMLAVGKSLRVSLRQMPLLAVLGLLFAGSSIGLFESYNYIPAGLGTTLIYLYPLFTALSMLFLDKSPSLRVWVTMAVTIAGVILLCLPSGKIHLSFIGIAFAVGSAFCYAMYLVIVNNSKVIKDVSAQTITFYSLVSGSALLCLLTALRGESLVSGFRTVGDWANVLALSVFSTLIAMLSIAVASRKIGPTRAGVLGVFEPLTAILIGVVAFHEILTPTMILGIVICILSVTIMIAGDR